MHISLSLYIYIYIYTYIIRLYYLLPVGPPESRRAARTGAAPDTLIS